MAAKSTKLPILTSAWSRLGQAFASWLPAYSGRMRNVATTASRSGTIPSNVR